MSQHPRRRCPASSHGANSRHSGSPRPRPSAGRYSWRMRWSSCG